MQELAKIFYRLFENGNKKRQLYRNAEMPYVAV